jgi:predicted DNA-binding transcriptional regulator YafY
MKDPGKLLRLFRELNLLSSSKRGYTVHELAEKVGVSYRTVYRDLRIFEETGFELIQNELSKRFRLSRAEELSENIAFKREEAEALQEALVGLPEGPLRQILLEKVQALSGSAQQVGLLHRQSMSANFHLLAQAIRDKRQVVLLDYRSASSHQISNRLVEPFAFSDQYSTVQCLEVSSRTTKFFKIERIGLVRIEGSPWQFEYLHESRKQDAFGMTLHKPKVVRFKMGLLSSNLLKEEYPAAAVHLRKEDDGRVLFDGEVGGYDGVGRFVLGLIDDIEPVGPSDFIDYLRQKAAKLL